MTKEEYARLLQSDYWKGYSYSLIKERDFTCEDCGRRFINERNKLQVHHLVYRDINPWSYKPEELVVLCEECHKKRHRIVVEPEAKPIDESSGDYSKSYSSTSKEKKSTLAGYIKFARLFNHRHKFKTHFAVSKRSMHRHSKKYWEYALYGFLILFFFSLLKEIFTGERPDEDVKETKTFIESSPPKKTAKNRSVVTTTKSKESAVSEITQTNKKTDIDTISEDINMSLNVEQIFDENVPQIEPSTSNIPTSENIEVTLVPEKSEDNKKLTISEISDRIYRKHVEEQAKREGVSTEGTTSEINERIYRKHVEEQAKREGVSTEDTTSTP